MSEFNNRWQITASGVPVIDGLYGTTRVSFFPVEVNGETRQLFAICEGIPVGPVLEQVSSLLSAAHLSYEFMSKNPNANYDVAWALYLQLEVARALVESVNRGVKD